MANSKHELKSIIWLHDVQSWAGQSLQSANHHLRASWESLPCLRTKACDHRHLHYVNLDCILDPTTGTNQSGRVAWYFRAAQIGFHGVVSKGTVQILWDFSTPLSKSLQHVSFDAACSMGRTRARTAAGKRHAFRSKSMYCRFDFADHD